MSLIFWDTNLWVYWLEDHPQFGDRVSQIRKKMLARGDRLCTSALTLGEILAGPYAKSNEPLAAKYRGLIGPPLVEIIPFTAAAADHYGRIRGDRTIRPADAIQLACAAQAHVDLFITNDRQLCGKVIPGVQFIVSMDAEVL